MISKMNIITQIPGPVWNYSLDHIILRGKNFLCNFGNVQTCLLINFWGADYFASLLQSSVAHKASEIILIY